MTPTGPVGMADWVSTAVEGTLLFMVGCDESSWPRARSLLLPIARDVVRCGGPGTGVTMKAIVNLLWLANYTADVEALVFAASAGISPEVASAVLGDTGASNRALGMAVDQLIPGEIRDGFPVRLAHKDVRLALATARRLGLDLASLEPTLAVLQEASADGMDGLGVAAYGKVIEDRHGIDLSRYSGGDDPDAVGGR